MFSREEYDELKLLLNNFDEDDPSSIDTLAILNRFEKQNALNEIHEIMDTYKTTTIDFWQKWKYGLYAVAGTLGISSIGVYITYVLKLLAQPEIQKAILLNEAISIYNNTLVTSINATCGNLIPLQGTLLNNIFHSPAAAFCLNIKRTKDYHPTMIENYNNRCMSNFKLENYCNWQELGDIAFNCAVRMNQYYLASCEHHPQLGPVDIDALKVCSEVYPISSGRELCYNPPENSAKINCGTVALEICNAWLRSSFNLTVPNQNFTCADKFISPDVFEKCKRAAYYYDDKHTSSEGRPSSLIIFFSSLGLLEFFVLGIFAVIAGVLWVNNKNQLNTLPAEEQDAFSQVLKECNIEVNIDEEMKVTRAIDLLDTTKRLIQNDKKIINDRRFSFLIGREDPNSDIPNDLPNDIAYKILYFSALFSKPPIEMTAVECEQKLSRNSFFMNNF